MSFAKAELFSSSEADCFRGVEVKLRLALNDDGSGRSTSTSSNESGSETGTCPPSPASDAQQSSVKDAQTGVKPPAGLRNQGSSIVNIDV
jgi:hypothetical protein